MSMLRTILISCIISYNYGMDFSSYTNSSRNNDNELILHKFLLSCIDHWNLNHLKIFFNEGSKNTIKSFLRLSELHLQASIHFGFNNETTFNILKKDHLSTSIFVFSDNSMISEVLNMLLDFKLRIQSHTIFLMCLDCKKPLTLIEGNDFISRIIVGIPQKLGFQLHELYYDYVIRSLRLSLVGSWNNITGFHMIHELKSKSEFSFRNATLKILNRHILPYGTTYNHSAGQFIPASYIGSVFLSLSTALNFSYDIRNSNASYYGELQSNGTFNGLIGEFIRMKYDIALGVFSATPSRRKVVDYTSPFFKEGVGVAAHSSTKLSGKTWTLLASLFKEQLWFGIVFLSVLLAITMSITLVWGYPRMLQKLDLFPLLLATWLQKGTEEEASNAVSAKIVIFTAYVFFWLIVCIYNAVLVTFLTLETNTIMTTFEELAHSEYAIETLRASNVVEMLKSSKNVALQSLSKKLKNVHSFAEGLKGVCDKKNQAFLGPITYFINLKRRQCQFYVIKELLTIDYYYFITQKHSILNRRLSKALAKLHETGILLRLQTLYNLKLSPNLNQDTKSSEVSLNHVIGPFLILIAGVILSILLLIWELGYSKVKPHLKQQKFEYKT